MTKSAKSLPSFVTAVSAAAALLWQQTAPAATVHPPVTAPASSGLLAAGFKNLHELNPGRAIVCFTPLLVHAAKKPLKEREHAQVTARYLVLIARSFAFDENYAASVQALTLAHRIDPDNQFATIYLADNLIRAGRDADSRPLFEAVSKMAPGNATADIFLSIDKFRSAEFKQSVQLAQEAARQKDGQKHWFVHHILSRAYARYGLKNESVSECLQAAKLAPTPYYAKLLEATASFLQRKTLSDTGPQAALLNAAGKFGDHDPLWCASLGALLSQQKDKGKQARDYMNQAVHCPRVEFKAFSVFADYLRTHKQVDSAWQCAQYVTNLMPYYYDCYTLQGNILLGRQKTAQARQCFEKAVQLAPRVSLSYIQLAALCWQANDHAAAIGYLEGCLKLMPQCAPAWQRLAEYEMENSQWQRARHDFEQALLFMPPASEAGRLNLITSHELGRVCSGLGALYYRDNNYALALKQAEIWNKLKFVPDLPAYLKIMKLRPGHIDTSNLLAKEKEAAQHAEVADMLYQNHQLDDCIKEYKLAVALNPEDLDLQEYLFSAVADSGNWLAAAGEDWALSNKLLGKAISAVTSKKEPAKTGEKRREDSQDVKDAGKDK